MKYCCTLLLLVAVACSTKRDQPQRAYETAWAEFRRGNLRSAQEHVDRALASDSHAPADQWRCRLELLRAEILLAQGLAKQALPLIDGQACGSQSQVLGLRRLLDRADALSKLEKYAEATALVERVESEAGKAALSELWLQSQVLKGAILQRTNRLGEAEELLHAAVDRAARDGDEYQRAMALVNLSVSKIRQYRFDEALPYTREALAAGERANAGRVVALAHNHFGIEYSRLGDFERAERHQSLAVKSLREIDDRRNLQAALGELGNLQTLQRKPLDAVPSFEQAYQIARDLNAPSLASRWAGNLALALIEAGKWNEADHWNNEARRLKRPEDTAGLVFLKLNDAFISAGRADLKNSEHLLRQVIAESKAIPFVTWQAHARLGRLYVQSRQYAKANAEFEKGLQVIEDVRSDLLQNEFKLSFLGRLIGFFQEYVDALVDQGQPLRALQVADYSRARVLAERLGREKDKIAAVDPRAFQAFARRTNSTLLSYWIAPRRSFVWIIEARGIQHFELPALGEIAALTASVRTLIEESLRDPVEEKNETAHGLSGALLQQAMKIVPSQGVVYIVPDGPLHQINLETLPIAGSNRYLLDEWRIRIAPSLSVIAGSKSRNVDRTAPLLLIGAPEAHAPEYPALPKAGEEIASIRKHLANRPAEIYTGPKATPRIYQEVGPERFSLIHFASHAEANAQSPLDSAVILSRDGDRFKLYARDVIDSSLNSELVTISACRSAGVRAYAGEGLVGFAWAFLQAGSRAVIAGLWDVSDSSTAALMDRLYAGIAGGQSPEDALRAAKLALRNGSGPFRKPFYWGPLQAYVRAPSLREP